MNKKSNFKIDPNDLIAKFLNGITTNEEVEILQLWINESLENREAFIQMRVSWMASAQVQKINPAETAKALNRLNRKIRMNEEKSNKHIIVRLKQFSRIAALILLAIAIGSLGTYMVFKGDVTGLNNALIYVYAPKGSKAVTILPDGTKVWLNAGSNLAYNCILYGKNNREVSLIGEGFFKVVSNAKKPFIVNAKNLKIKALGTEFNVKAYPDELNVETTLVEGIVKIEGEGQKKHRFSLTLKPNQQVSMPMGRATINKVTVTDPNIIETKKLKEIKLESLSSNIEVEPTINNVKRTELFTSWKDDRWIFNGEEIGNLAKLLERRYNISIVFNSEELKKYKFTGTFQNETIEQVMQVLKLTTPLQYEIGKGKVFLNLDSALKIKYKKYIVAEE